MNNRRRKKTTPEEGPFLFSEEEMAGLIEKVTIVEPTETPPPAQPSAANEVAPLDDDRMIAEMVAVIRRLADMDAGRVRLIALMTTALGQQGINLRQTYNVPAVSPSPLTGYELAGMVLLHFHAGFPPDEGQFANALCAPLSESQGENQRNGIIKSSERTKKPTNHSRPILSIIATHQNKTTWKHSTTSYPTTSPCWSISLPHGASRAR